MSRLRRSYTHGPLAEPSFLRSPQDRPPPQTASRPPHLASADDPNFSWQRIWAFFMRAPRVRAWLFQKDPPPRAHVVQALMSSPMLIGYILSSSNEALHGYAHPDIGDLQTVFCRDGEALLGFHFGFQGIQPIIPLLFQVIKDPMLGDPAVIVRRTARQRGPPPFQDYYFSIEFNWFAAGMLGVCASVSPVDPATDAPTGLCPTMLRAEHRVFTRRSAERLFRMAEVLGRQADPAFNSPLAHAPELPGHFLDPSDDYYSLTVREPDDAEYYAALQPAYVPVEDKTQIFEIEKDFPSPGQSAIGSTTTADSVSTATTLNTASTSTNSNGLASGSDGGLEQERNLIRRDTSVVSKSGHGGLAAHCDRGDVSSVAEERTMMRWKSYQNAVARSRRAGKMITMLAVKKGGSRASAVPVFGRESRYVFLSTSGISVRGRIQLLFSQLGIQIGSPRPLNIPTLEAKAKRAANEMYEDAPARIEYLGRPTTEADAEQKLIEAGNFSGNFAAESWRRTHSLAGTDRGHRRNSVAARSSIELQSDSGSGQSWPEGRYPMMPNTLGKDVMVDMRYRSPSLCSDPSSYTSGLKGPDTSQDVRYPKRRRCVSSNGNGNIADEAEIPIHNQHFELQPSGGHFEVPVVDEATGVAGKPQHKLEELGARRRSCDLMNIMSDENSYGSPNEASVSTCRFTSGSNALSVGDPSIPTVTKNRESASKHAAGAERRESILRSGSQGVSNAGGEVDVEKGKGSRTVWTCDICGVKIRGKKGNFNRHIANKHENIRAFECTVENCGRKFQTRLNLVRHDTAVHKGRPHTCGRCPRAFKYEKDLVAHVKAAHENSDGQLACEICGSCFGRRSTLNRHMAKVHKAKEDAAASSAS